MFRYVFKNMGFLVLSFGLLSAPRLSGTNPLHTAVKDGDFEEVQKLLKTSEGKRYIDQEEGTTTPLIEAIQDWGHERKDYIKEFKEAYEKIALELINKGANVSHVDGFRCPLWNAANYGVVEVVKAIINKSGVDINCGNHMGYKYSVSPLYTAARENHADVVEVLVQKGAKLVEEKTEGKGPQKKTVYVDLVFEDKGFSPLYYAAYWCNLRMAKALVEPKGGQSRGLNVNWKTREGTTLLEVVLEPSKIATEDERLAFVAYLIGKKIDVNALSHDKSPLTWALEGKFFKIARFLEMNGAKPSSKEQKEQLGKIPPLSKEDLEKIKGEEKKEDVSKKSKEAGEEKEDISKESKEAGKEKEDIGDVPKNLKKALREFSRSLGALVP
jgi:ankyrin repeat protein